MTIHPADEEGIMRTAAGWWTQLRDPEPSVETLERWQAWLAADERHAEAFAQCNALGEVIAGASAAQRQALVDEFAPHPARPRHMAYGWAVAASIAVVALLGWQMRWGAPGPGAALQYATAVGENRVVQLADGTDVELGAASSITARYAAGRRDIDLSRGEAFFTVTHDGSRPFVVAAGPLQIEDLGTAFNVRRTGDRVTVAVTEGRVRLSGARTALDGGGTSPGRLDLVAGQRAEYDPRTGAVSVSTVAPEHAAAWRDDRLEFIDEPLASVIANVNRYSRLPVQLADERAGALLFTGTVNVTTIDSWIGALPQVFPLRVSRFADHVVLSSTGHQ